VLTQVGGAFAGRLRPFLLTLAIVDDIIALLVIALVYTSDLSIRALVRGAAVRRVLLMRRAGVRHGVAYFVVALGLWIATLTSGVHATIAGVAMGLLATAAPPSRERLERASALWRLFREEPTPQYARTASRSVALTISPNERLQYLFHPWTSYVIVPLFALANAGIRIDAGARSGTPRLLRSRWGSCSGWCSASRSASPPRRGSSAGAAWAASRSACRAGGGRRDRSWTRSR
jgi:Na+/H+ antiporter NhaA